MFWIKTIKQIKKELKKIAEAFRFRDEKIFNNQERINRLEGALAILMSKSAVVHEQPARTPPTAIRRRANKILNKVEIMQEMASLLHQGLSTTEIHNIIVNEKALIKKTCFFKYIKIVREQSARTPRTKHREPNK